VIFLCLQVVFASSFILIIKWAQLRDREDVITIGLINYIAAAVLIAPLFFGQQFSEISLGAMWTGGSMGAIYFVAFFFAIYSIKVVGASSTTVVSVLSILFPITVAAFVWDEIPNFQQMLGIGLALLALLLIGFRTNKQPSEERAWLTPLILLGFFFLCGCSRLSQEAFKHVSEPEQRATFVITAFTVAAIPSLIVLLVRRKKIKKMEWVFGVSLGLANMLQTHLILNCLEFYPGFIVFPVVSAGAIVLTTMVATGMMKERLNMQTCTGIGLAVIALFMLQWIPA
jgi:drug/metabolite transporter (DMT)-like permease